uniref:FERM domain-containing protein n=1 Tax=Strongyloides papillosus TaxID=174720 RepID=A0A0N5BEZ7_STREA
MGSQNKEAILDEVGSSRNISIQGTLEFYKSKKWVTRVVLAQKFADLEEPIVTVFKTIKQKKSKKGGKTCTLNDFVAICKDIPIGKRDCTLAVMTLNFDLYFSFERPLSQLIWYNWMKQCCPAFKALDMQFLKGPNYYNWMEGKQCTMYITKTNFIVKSHAIRGLHETILQGYHEEFKFKRREDRILEVKYMGTKYSWYFCGPAIYEILKVHRALMKNILDKRVPHHDDIDKYTEGYWLQSIPTLASRDPESCGNSTTKSNCSSTNSSLKFLRVKKDELRHYNSLPSNVIYKSEHKPSLDYYVNSNISNHVFSEHQQPSYVKSKNNQYVKRGAKSTTNLTLQNKLDPIYENLQIKDIDNKYYKNNKNKKMDHFKRLSKSVNNIYINEDTSTILTSQTSQLPSKGHKEVTTTFSLPLGPRPINLNKPLSYYFSPSLSDINNGEIPGLVKTTGDKKLSFKNIKKTVNKVFRKSITGSFTKYDGDRKSDDYNNLSETCNTDKYMHSNLNDTLNKSNNNTKKDNLHNNYATDEYIENSNNFASSSYLSKKQITTPSQKTIYNRGDISSLKEKKKFRDATEDFNIYVNTQI